MRKSKKTVLKRLWMFVFCGLMAMGANAQTVTGRVTDSKDGSGLPGVTVNVKGTKKSTTTSADGSYSISAPGTATLVFSSVGYDGQQVAVGGRTTVDVALVQGANRLNEVVVVGYGTARKKDVTGSLTTVTAKDFQKGNITSPEQLIVGKVAGVQIISNGGSPGAGSTIRIRGGASLNANNDPLIIVDGVPLEQGKGIPGSPNGLSLINPNDIESFTILKDASSTAIYGSRASNGVILITTKRGRSGKPVMSFSTQFSVSKVSRKAEVLSADELRNFVKTSPYSNSDFVKLLGDANTDWQKQIYQTALTTDNNFSISGAYHNIPVRVSVGYLRQEGVLKTDRMNRGSLGLALTPRLWSDHIKLDINLRGSTSENRFANQGAIGAAVNFDPTKPVHSGSARFGGYYEWLDPASKTGLRGLAPLNPVGLLEQTQDNGSAQRSIGNLQIDYKVHFLPDLHVIVNLGYDISKGKGRVVVSDSAAQAYHRFNDAFGVARGGNNNRYKQITFNTVTDAYLNYGKDIRGIKTRVDITAGHEYLEFKSKYFSFPDYSYDNQLKENSVPFFGSSTSVHSMESYFTRGNFSILDRYVITGSYRADGSSRFNKSNRWSYFPSAAFAWKIKSEGFLRNSRLISELKARIGYGSTGNQEVGNDFIYIKRYSQSSNQSQYQFGGTYYYTYTPVSYNENLRWEKTTTSNLGLDFGFADNRITGSVDYYLKETSDLVNNVDVPAGDLANKITKNVGKMENRGVEVTLNLVPIKRKNVNWDLNFNATYNQNRITQLTNNNNPKYPGDPVGGISGGTGNYVLINSVGLPVNSFYVFHQVYDKNGKLLDDVYEDVNRDGVINESDRYKYRSVNPDWLLGFSTNFNYKAFSAGFVLRASIGNYMYNNVFSSTGTARNILNPLSYLSNGSKEVLRSGLSGNGQNYYMSDYWIENASFLKMDNLYLGYNVGQVFKGARMRVNAAVQNVFVVTKYKGVDPEISGGVDNNFYPRPRTYSLGLGLDF